jgi:GNAT superfamily N-acetyltransferase
MPDLSFRHHDTRGARAVRETVALIHRDAYADAIASGDPFASHEAFMHRFDAHTAHPSLDLVLAYAGDEPVGQAWGWPESAAGTGLPAETTRGTEPGFPDEISTRTFALAEIMVRRAWTGQGVAHALHDELLAARTEQQAELYVRPGNVNAYRAYLKWGWRKAGETRPDLPGAPLFDVLVLALPPTSLGRLPGAAPAPDSAEERLPSRRAERKVAAAGILGVAHPDAPANAGDFNALIPGVAVAGFAPLDVCWCGFLRAGHRGSFASMLIMAADSPGARAWLTRLVQARLKRSSSSSDSR